MKVAIPQSGRIIMDSPYWTITIRLPKPNRRWIRYHLRTFLLMALIAGILAGLYGSSVRRRMEARKYISFTYDVSDLLGPPSSAEPAQPDWERLLSEIKATVAPSTWEEEGGLGTIQCFKSNLAIVVRQKEAVHKEFCEWREAKRGRAEADKK
jgi:hypothetical protein